MQPGVKYSIVSRRSGETIEGYVIDNTYFIPAGSGDMEIGDIVDGVLRHRDGIKSTGINHALRVDGLMLIDERGDVFDLVAQKKNIPRPRLERVFHF